MVFATGEMSRRPDPLDDVARLAGHIGYQIADTRRSRRMTLRELSRRAGLAVSSAHAVEHGRPASLATYAALARALAMDLRLDLFDPRRRSSVAVRAEDPVHAAMGELEARQLTTAGRVVALDEPYQHYQFAGRADVLVSDLSSGALLHIENRTRFPNIQDALGAYNAKRRYLPGVLAERLALRRGFESITHVMAVLPSSEALHEVRIHAATFRATCPDPPDDVLDWWTGGEPAPREPTSTLMFVDPVHDIGRRRRLIPLDAALRPSFRPRYRGYTDALHALADSGAL